MLAKHPFHQKCESLTPGVGAAILIVSALCVWIYTVPFSWMLYYLGSSLAKDVPWRNCNNTWNTEKCDEIIATNMSITLHDVNDVTHRHSNVTVQNNGSLISASEEFWE